MKLAPGGLLPPTYAERQAAALADPLIAAMWKALKPIRSEREDTRLVTPFGLRGALATAIERQATIMRRDHGDVVLIAEYDRLAGELRRAGQ